LYIESEENREIRNVRLVGNTDDFSILLKILKIFLNLIMPFEQVINNYFDIFDTLLLEIDQLNSTFYF